MFPRPLIKFFNPGDYHLTLGNEVGMESVYFSNHINGRAIFRDVSVRKWPPLSFLSMLVTLSDYIKDSCTRPMLETGDRITLSIKLTYRGIDIDLGTFELYFYGPRGDYTEMDEVQRRLSIEKHFLIEIHNGKSMMMSGTSNTSCLPSITMVNGRLSNCVGDLLFFDDFQQNVLNRSKWTIEKRIAMEPDHEFVVYLNHSLSTGSGLRLEPKLLTDVFGANALLSDLIVADCTAPKDPMACAFSRRKFRRYLPPPVVSSQVTTSGHFSFMYGRIEIVARLPRGDWIFPRLWLQPREYKYDKTDYKAGVIYVGSIENSPPGVYLVKQGIALGAEDPVRSMLLSPRRMPKDWDKSFHTFIVEWTPGKYLNIFCKSEITLFFIT